ncbi:MAG: glycosyltransferase [Candidatus Aminicenantes bacterium]|nr:MAG: glycosyltransferase [Candidatus Aminicenantes bacterium]
MLKPEITVLMSVYNGEKFLEEAIESILNQSLENFEFLIIDDGSTDKSPEIIKSYRDTRIKLIQNNKNSGLVRNLNRGIARARGKYIARMDADDISLPTRLEEQYKFMESHRNIAVCGTWVTFIGAKIDALENNVLKNPSNPEEIRCWFLFNCVLKHPTVIIRKEVLDREGYLYSEAFNRAEDYDLWARISGKYDLSNLEKVLLKYRVHPDSISQVHMEENIKQANEIRKSQLLELGINPSAKEIELHFELTRLFRKEFPFQRLWEANEWLQKIYHYNKKRNLYDDGTLLKVLSAKFAAITKIISKPEWMTFKERQGV